MGLQTQPCCCAGPGKILQDGLALYGLGSSTNDIGLYIPGCSIDQTSTFGLVPTRKLWSGRLADYRMVLLGIPKNAANSSLTKPLWWDQLPGWNGRVVFEYQAAPSSSPFLPAEWLAGFGAFWQSQIAVHGFPYLNTAGQPLILEADFNRVYSDPRTNGILYSSILLSAYMIGLGGVNVTAWSSATGQGKALYRIFQTGQTPNDTSAPAISWNQVPGQSAEFVGLSNGLSTGVGAISAFTPSAGTPSPGWTQFLLNLYNVPVGATS